MNVPRYLSVVPLGLFLVLVVTPVAHASVEVGIHDEPNLEQTSFLIPTGSTQSVSPCPTYTGDGELVKKEDEALEVIRKEAHDLNYVLVVIGGSEMYKWEPTEAGLAKEKLYWEENKRAEERHNYRQSAPCRYKLVVKHWSPEAKSWRTVLTKQGGGEEAEVEMQWSCQLEGKISWSVELWTEDGTWRDHGSGKFNFSWPAGCSPLPHLRSFWTSRREARQAVKNRLYPMFVSHLVCKRTGKGFNCKTIYNDTTTECRAVFGAVREGWVGGSEPNSYFVSVGVVTKHCHSF